MPSVVEKCRTVEVSKGIKVQICFPFSSKLQLLKIKVPNAFHLKIRFWSEWPFFLSSCTLRVSFHILTNNKHNEENKHIFLVSKISFSIYFIYLIVYLFISVLLLFLFSFTSMTCSYKCRNIFSTTVINKFLYNILEEIQMF